MSTDPYAIDWAEHADRLAAAAADEAGWYAATAATLVRPDDRVAVDVGCGGGGMAAALAAALGPDALVVAADGDPTVLAGARAALAGTPRVAFVVADVGRSVEPIRSAAGGADLVWASASVHHVGDQQAAVTALAGLLRPGGRLALAEGGLPSRHLPWDLGVGEPGLEARLDAAQDRWFAGMRAGLPGSVPMPYGWTVALRRAGLAAIASRTTVLERPIPLSASDLAAVVGTLAHRVDRLRPTGLLEPADLAAWDRLLHPADPASLTGRDDVFSLTARTVHLGTRPA